MSFLGKLWDRSIFNRVINRPRLLYHGTSSSYYNKEKFKDYYKHSSSSGVWFERNPKKAVRWAVIFASRFEEDEPVLIVVNASKLKSLRKNWLLFHKGIWRPPYLRANSIKKKFAVMVKLEFKKGWKSKWNGLTNSCKNKIAMAELKVR